MSFETLGLAPALLSAVQEAGFSTPTPVQASAIPQALAGHDLMVSSQTGSGKTAAFMLPALHRIAQMPANKGVGVQVLVLTPTRELALQVTEATATYGRKLADLRTATVVGGMPYGAQLKALSRRVDVLVATPGRLIDHLQSGRVKLNTVHTLVLDEADRMLDMGFIEDIETIVSRLPAERQTLLFSATLDGTIAKLAARMMRDPQRIEMAGSKEKHTNITQSLLYADDASHKMQLLDHVLRDASLDQAIVFTSTKRGADDLADRLADQGFAAAALHGDMNQRQRTRTLSQLQRGQLRILVATDVAARGIDVQGISHAVNFDLPMQAEDYVHRIGRTGRAGRNGLAFTLATHSERHKVRRIEHYIGQSITPEVIAGLEPKRTPRPSTGAAPRGGKPFGKRPGGFGGGYQGNRDGGSREGRSFGGPRGEFKPREGGYQGARDGAPREGGYQGNRPFGDRPARSFSDRPSFGDRPQREGGYQGNRPFGDRPQREGGFRGADRDSRPSFSDRPSFGDRPQRDPRPFNERAPREGGFRGADRDARPSFSDRPSFGDRPQREGGFRGGDRPEGGFRGKPTFDKRPGGPAKRFAKPAGDRRG
ncbi:ATP-dependent RNA helicase RhlE [Achromobacter deleyi]|uniref:DEAD-box ATP-dependent RNA helicase RhpA n=1 Tax=Achromobacter deleyi TaxID=1353891 RepID=A0A6S7AN32_9BURK|nr:DEAD/DEAH box helicase [Achromobacter deleyi]CAB3677352.1 ATP-dependent RNA helicase RhlE [Achromobacter deleyi]CAB3866312.1 ATP-dependent RNA helicase RhlE [Achromobacter deleyi]CAB3911719.1 ATP-dependent RNA helicase RhlE [Achromobacter deleyi]CAB3916360.1 ATP-dependent RNA helicase RhlE [Achromobacter deleyi]